MEWLGLEETLKSLCPAWGRKTRPKLFAKNHSTQSKPTQHLSWFKAQTPWGVCILHTSISSQVMTCCGPSAVQASKYMAAQPTSSPYKDSKPSPEIWGCSDQDLVTKCLESEVKAPAQPYHTANALIPTHGVQPSLEEQEAKNFLLVRDYIIFHHRKCWTIPTFLHCPYLFLISLWYFVPFCLQVP